MTTPQFSRLAVSGQTQVPLYSSKCKPTVHFISRASPSMQLQKILQTDSSGWAKKPFLRGQNLEDFGSSKNVNLINQKKKMLIFCKARKRLEKVYLRNSTRSPQSTLKGWSHLLILRFNGSNTKPSGHNFSLATPSSHS